MEFRNLRADEINVRVATVKAPTVKEKGRVSLLLYKDARCDANILDETVGAENWQDRYYEVKGNLFCSVGINVNYEKNAEPLWIWKDDCGTESYTEKEKGEASDAFKRACFRWNIGRNNLYSSPSIRVNSDDCKIYDTNRTDKNGKAIWGCNDSFYVSLIEYDEQGKIKKLVVNNKDLKKAVFCFGYDNKKTNKTSQDKASKDVIKQINELIEKTQTDLHQVLGYYSINNLEELTGDEADECFITLQTKLAKQKG